MPGYSGTPLVRKLGVKEGFRVYTKNAPGNYLRLLEPIPKDVSVLTRLANDLDMVHFFTRSRTELGANLSSIVPRIKQAGMIWISWPKKASKVPTDVTEDVVRAEAFPLGLVDIKVCAVDDTWSGLKLVIRKENRK